MAAVVLIPGTAGDLFVAGTVAGSVVVAGSLPTLRVAAAMPAKTEPAGPTNLKVEQFIIYIYIFTWDLNVAHPPRTASSGHASIDSPRFCSAYNQR